MSNHLADAFAYMKNDLFGSHVKFENERIKNIEITEELKLELSALLMTQVLAGSGTQSGRGYLGDALPEGLSEPGKEYYFNIWMILSGGGLTNSQCIKVLNAFPNRNFCDTLQRLHIYTANDYPIQDTDYRKNPARYNIPVRTVQQAMAISFREVVTAYQNSEIPVNEDTVDYIIKTLERIGASGV